MPRRSSMKPSGLKLSKTSETRSSTRSSSSTPTRPLLIAERSEKTSRGRSEEVEWSRMAMAAPVSPKGRICGRWNGPEPTFENR